MNTVNRKAQSIITISVTLADVPLKFSSPTSRNLIQQSPLPELIQFKSQQAEMHSSIAILKEFCHGMHLLKAEEH